jgi:hypothetical protein
VGRRPVAERELDVDTFASHDLELADMPDAYDAFGHELAVDVAEGHARDSGSPAASAWAGSDDATRHASASSITSRSLV